MSATLEAATQSPAESVTTRDSWVKRGIHTVHLPSGAKVQIKFPDLSRLIRSNLLPEGLRAAALRQAFDDLEMPAPADATPMTEEQRKTQIEERFKMAQELVELVDFLLLEMMVEPKLTREEVGEIPGEDRDMLAAIAQRERSVDARGVRLGVAPLEAFHEFREFHGCDEHGDAGCPSCKALQQRFSSVDVGGV